MKRAKRESAVHTPGPWVVAADSEMDDGNYHGGFFW